MKRKISLGLIMGIVLVLAAAVPASAAYTNADCLGCHTPASSGATTKVDFAVPLLSPADKEVACPVCHAGQHGQTYTTPYGTFTSASSLSTPPATLHSYHFGVSKSGLSGPSTFWCSGSCHYAPVDCQWCHRSGVTHEIGKHGNGTGTVVPADTVTVVTGSDLATQPHTTQLTCMNAACHSVTANPGAQPTLDLAPSCAQSSCHGSASHETAHDPDAALASEYSNCGASGCHLLNVAAEHTSRTLRSTGQLGTCATCHSSTSGTVLAAIAAGSGLDATGNLKPQQGCFVCHSADAGQHQLQHALSDPVAPPAECQYCHPTNLISDHISPSFPADVNSSPVIAVQCGTCHDASSVVNSVVASYGGANVLNPACATCHNASLLPGHTTQDIHRDRHTSSSTSCVSSTCHAAGNLVDLHGAKGFTCDTCHNATQSTRMDTVRGAVLANSTDCQSCHQGHYLQHTLPSGKEIGSGFYKYSNQTGGTIDCAQCHLNNLIAEHTGDGAARPAWLDAAANPLICGTCHDSTRSDVQAAIAQGLTPTPDDALTNCDQCHTVHGTPTLEHNSSFNADPAATCGQPGGCHNSNLLVEHEQRWSISTISPNDTAMVGGVCSRCHLATDTGTIAKTTVLGAIDTKDTKCTACHGSNAGRHTLQHELTDPTSPECAAAGCHVSNLVTEHTVDHPLSCATCHNSGDPTVRIVIATYGGTNALNPRCVECHTSASSAHIIEHDPDSTLSSTYASCGTAGCHALNINTEHVDVRMLSCATCHSSTNPTVTAAIAAGKGSGPQQGCFVCHGSSAGQHQTQHELTKPADPSAECRWCHATNLVSDHISPTFPADVNEFVPVSPSFNCATCHDGSAAVKAVITLYAPNPGANPMCANCHTVTAIHKDQHAATSSPSCVTLSCHPNGGNLVDLHAAYGKTCDTCHSGTRPVAVENAIKANDTRCESCHQTYHVQAAAKHTANESTTDCGSCHLLAMPDEHNRSTSITADGFVCDSCHPLPVSVVSAWTASKACDDCHNGSTTLNSKVVPARHQQIGSRHQSTQTSCVISGCHVADLRTVHSALGCKNCHSTTSVPTSSDCKTCHPSSPHHGPTPFKWPMTQAGIYQACSTACHEHNPHNPGYCWDCHGPDKSKDMHKIDYHRDHDKATCSRCHDVTNNTRTTCLSCHSFGSGWASTFGVNDGFVYGRVTNAATGAGVAGATVLIDGKSTSTDTDGYFAVADVAPSTYTVTASAAGYSSMSISTTLTAGDGTKLDFALTQTTGAINGRATSSAGGAAISGATVTATPGSYSATTDSNGYYTLSGLAPGNYTVTASAAGYTSAAASATVTAGVTATVNLALAPTITTTEYTISTAMQYSMSSNTNGDPSSGTDVTSRMNDNTLTNSSYAYTIQNNSRVISFQLNQNGNAVQKAVLRLYVYSLNYNQSQTLRFYTYGSDGRNLTSTYAQLTVSGTGWKDFDITNVVKSMNYPGWFKVRVVDTSSSLKVSEARYVLTK